MLLRRRPTFQDGPGLVFVIAYGNLTFQIVVPSPIMDKGLVGRGITLSSVPMFPFMNPANVKGPTKYWTEHLNNPNPTKGEQSITMSFESMEETMPGLAKET